MKPLSGMWLYINLGFAVMWDFLGFILFIINFIPVIQVFSIVGSFVLDIVAIMTDIVFCAIYYGYLGIYYMNLKLYQGKKITELLRLSRTSRNVSPSQSKIQQGFARKTQEASKYMLGKIGDYIMEFGWKRIVSLIVKGVVEAIPFLGDFSPTWTIGAWLHIKAHRKRAKQMKEDNEKFEDSINKWRQSLSISGAINNIRGFNRSLKPQPVKVGAKR
jgi:hypothetical protein